MKRPLIGLSGRRKKAHQVAGFPQILDDFDIDVYSSNYAQAVLEAGGMPMHLPIDVDPREAMDHLDGLLLSGGADIAPARYGRTPQANLYTPEDDRDEFELGLLDGAVARKLPVLGICRGIQMVNVHAGGTLHQHVPEHAGFEAPPTTEWHKIEIEADSLLNEFYGETRAVNSLHHQTLDDVASCFRVTARSDDGTVEGIEHFDLPIVAVQWHPEMLPERSTDPLFTWLVNAAR